MSVSVANINISGEQFVNLMSYHVCNLLYNIAFSKALFTRRQRTTATEVSR